MDMAVFSSFLTYCNAVWRSKSELQLLVENQQYTNTRRKLEWENVDSDLFAVDDSSHVAKVVQA